ncbi:MAG: hypothetical protein FRX48_07562 [Lasallia pustulata]|uniref:GDP/GTP exchange factor Sec2 N-terminal domain-containing protein n=1 Tax=Lasallia pustulata TaxID=136370 RepID=A0A5M8PHT1_9LECA|nr:MAG: hypothetical protein FRX48_07562 [Lasallia pustulata]
MSTTSTTTLVQPSTAPIRNSSAPACHNCGANLSHAQEHAVAQDAQQRISELETQVKLLTSKATAAVDKLADYEDELRQLKSTPHRPSGQTSGLPSASDPNVASSQPRRTSTPSGPPPRPSTATAAPGPRTSIHQPLQNRLSSLLTSHRSPSQPPAPASAPLPAHARTPSETELLTALAREQALRAAAEANLSQTNEELEELSAQLFQQANEMVATERRARAKLEERVEVLERSNGEKRKRLEVLESRMGRIERVRALLKEGGANWAVATGGTTAEQSTTLKP